MSEGVKKGANQHLKEEHSAGILLLCLKKRQESGAVGTE